MKARIHDHGGRLRIEIDPENQDESMLLRAFIREHSEGPDAMLLEWVQVEGRLVTFGRRPPREVIHVER